MAPVLPFACLAAALAFAPSRSLAGGILAGGVNREPPPAIGATLPDVAYLVVISPPGGIRTTTVPSQLRRGPAQTS